MAITAGSGGSTPTKTVSTYSPVRKITAPKVKPPTGVIVPIKKTGPAPSNPGPTGGSYAVRPDGSPTYPGTSPAVVPTSGAGLSPVAAKAVDLYGPGGYTGGAPANSAQQTSSTDSAAEQKKQEEEAAAQAAAVKSADDVLKSQLDAIAAQFGMTRAQLEADEGEAGRQYRQAAAGLMRQRDANLEASLNQMIERGIIRSGITLQREGDIRRDFRESQSAALGDREFQLAQIAAQQASLDPQQAAAEASATAEHERAILDLETMRALANGGL